MEEIPPGTPYDFDKFFEKLPHGYGILGKLLLFATDSEDSLFQFNIEMAQFDNKLKKVTLLDELGFYVPVTYSTEEFVSEVVKKSEFAEGLGRLTTSDPPQ